jgi:hypothetical protein
LDYYAPGYVFTGNALIAAGGKTNAYPPGNFFPATIADVKFTDVSSSNYRLLSSSPLHLAGTDNLDVGANVGSVLSATANAISGQ